MVVSNFPFLQIFVNAPQSATEENLWKNKMAIDAISNHYFVFLEHPRSPFVHRKRGTSNFVLIE